MLAVKHAKKRLTSTETGDANMSETATKLQTFSHHTLLFALSEITSLFFTFLLIVLRVSPVELLTLSSNIYTTSYQHCSFY